MASHDVLLETELNEERYVALLTKLIGESEHVQNNPPKFIPTEDKYVEGTYCFEHFFLCFYFFLQNFVIPPTGVVCFLVVIWVVGTSEAR